MAAKKPAPKTQPRTTSRKIQKPKQKPDMNAKWSILIFGAGILLLALAFVKGESVWLAVHNFIVNSFGITAFLIGPVIITAAVLVATQKPMWGKLIKLLVFVLVISGTMLVFSNQTFTDMTFLQVVKHLYEQEGIFKSGVTGIIFGYPLLLLCGRPAANIILIIFVIIAVMLVTGVTPYDIFIFIKNHGSKAKQAAQEHMEARAAQMRYDAEQKQEENENVIDAKAFKSAKQSRLTDFNIDLGPEAEETVDNEEEKPIIGPGGTFGIYEKQEDSVPFETEEEIDEPKPEITLPVNEPQAPIADLIKKAVGVRAEIVPDKNDQMTIVPAVSDREGYSYPPLSLFHPQKIMDEQNVEGELEHNAKLLVETLESFGVKTRVLDISRGPSVTRYELQPLAGVKISRITNLADDIALNLATAGVRIEAPIPNKAAVGIEVPNRVSTPVSIRSVLESSAFSKSGSPLALALGKDIAGSSQVADLSRMPHLLIAGSTGSGKSVCINSIVISMLYKSSPEDVKLIMIDPKVVELAEYNGIPHLLMPVVTEPRKAAGALGSAVAEMERRYRLFAENNVRDIKTFNKLAQDADELEKLPYIVIIIDELADLMMVAGKEVEDYICRIAQKARAAGMHLIVATQRPSVDVITGLIKANIPSRIAFAVSSQIDSRTILDAGGAEKLLGMGDMLFMPVGANKPVRMQGTYVKDEEISAVLEFIKRHGAANYNEAMIEDMEKRAVSEKTNSGSSDDDSSRDPMLNSAVEVLIDAGMASTSLLQRKLKLGYARAARIIDELEAMHIVGPYEGSKPRQVLINRQQWIEMTMQQSDNE